MNNENELLLKKIRSKGYWHVVIRPTIFDKDLKINLEDLKQIVNLSQVTKRGWYYPHIDREKNIFISGKDSIASFANWESYYEYWQFYENMQFVHLFAMREDYYMNDVFKEKIRNSYLHYRPSNEEKIDKFLSIIPTLFSITEIYYFAANVVKFANFKKEINITITLKDTDKRALCIDEPGFRNIYKPYTCNYEPVELTETLNALDLLNRHLELALNKTIELFHRFNWTDPNPEVFAKDQENFMNQIF